ncbi:hypothetical protein BBK36DRAFT_1199317 [Trichoderma citrinoviride]|uniref:Uncharacterized protein n=1 Tax=Trichoderma citrinoviride TaxID=58853 RepID=A0A2T4BCS4_9HYPO|nr:hypothetical protein BBK36DRAFT_1199317 [Trichoderma citrinoviride]PTB67041.1 hypothetical protein BBK36DRAFT_1199317 [Trichoderma citrinoviride]
MGRTHLSLVVSEDCIAGMERKKYPTAGCGGLIQTESDYHQPSSMNWSTRLPSMLAPEGAEEEEAPGEEEEEAPGEEEEDDREAPGEEEDHTGRWSVVCTVSDGIKDEILAPQGFGFWFRDLGKGDTASSGLPSTTGSRVFGDVSAGCEAEDGPLS